MFTLGSGLRASDSSGADGELGLTRDGNGNGTDGWLHTCRHSAPTFLPVAVKLLHGTSCSGRVNVGEICVVLGREESSDEN